MAKLVFQLHSFWHAGTGRGDGAAADAVVCRSRHGLPYIPGRSVKGLIRDAVRLAMACDSKLATEDEVKALLGSDLPARVTSENHESHLEESRFRTESGALSFGSAELGEDWQAWACVHERDTAHLFTRIASTKIDERGVAHDQSLRTVEVAIPMRLEASIEGLTPAALRILRAALPLIRGLGSHRHRGLGRVSVELMES